MTSRRTTHVAFFCAWLAISCGPELDIEAHAKNCAHDCETHLVCPYLANPMDSKAESDTKIANCTEGCIEDGEDAMDQRRSCGVSFGDLIECLARLNCDEYREWGMRGPGEYPCYEEYTLFNDECVGIWGNVEE